MARGVPLQVEVGTDTLPQAEDRPTLDARNAAAQVLATYLESLTFRVWSSDGKCRDFRLNSVQHSWPEPEVALDYPTASITEGPYEYEPHGLVPSMLEDTVDTYCAGHVLWKTGELVTSFQVDVWTTNEAEREAIAAELERAFSPGESRSGVLLGGHERYFDRSVRATIETMERQDTQTTTWGRERRLRVEVAVEMDVVHSRQVSELQPTVLLSVEDGT